MERWKVRERVKPFTLQGILSVTETVYSSKSMCSRRENAGSKDGEKGTQICSVAEKGFLRSRPDLHSLSSGSVDSAEILQLGYELVPLGFLLKGAIPPTEI